MILFQGLFIRGYHSLLSVPLHCTRLHCFCDQFLFSLTSTLLSFPFLFFFFLFPFLLLQLNNKLIILSAIFPPEEKKTFNRNIYTSLKRANNDLSFLKTNDKGRSRLVGCDKVQEIIMYGTSDTTIPNF